MFLNYDLVDVFTATPFLGNPLAIVRVPASYRSTLSQETKQKIAVEFNLSETIFLHEPSEGCQDPLETLAIDTFTPKCEIPFAGHPTIGTAAYIFQNFPGAESGIFKALVTKAGHIPVSQDSATGLVSASIPQDYHMHQARIPSNVTISDASPVVSLAKGLSFVLAELRDVEILARISSGLLKDCVNPQNLDEGWNVGLIGTKYFVDLGKDDQGCRQLRTRMFVTWEDPGTGSASSALACFLALRETKEQGSGPFHYHIIQGVEMGRRNDIYVRVSRSEDGEKISEVLLQGASVSVGEGRIAV
ncbi:PhzF family phenazine biosynthesis protein [Aspergillus ibericus CBS 121593]|uniref:Diaminopimelate epimerase-like protein n=1 Tax=Aspergillus ibericus CBS 121593 TaxID=1448316 RepID=A0A395GZJ8_9EURO|nr:Diaminopimelate epimerase-like protein [Aspergillus ibericus CBS 121593]RAL00763.1 Diaminopimelate epimerase-like protein [Aspergillus ibericus CBS 121593]